MHPVVLCLPRRNGSEDVVVVKHLDGSVHIPVVGGTQGHVKDAAVFVDGDGSAKGLAVIGIRTCGGDRSADRSAFADDVSPVAISERECSASRCVPGHRRIIDHEPLGEVAVLRRAERLGAVESGELGALTPVGSVGVQAGRRARHPRAGTQCGVVDGLRGRRRDHNAGPACEFGGPRLVNIRVTHLIGEADGLGRLPDDAVIDGDRFPLGVREAGIGEFAIQFVLDLLYRPWKFS